MNDTDMNGQRVGVDPPTYQEIAYDWCRYAFGDEAAVNKTERSCRFLEEALELFQAMAMPKRYALELVEYVYGRDPGRPEQEVGGVSMTLACLCAAAEIDMLQASIKELDRVRHPDMLEVIRRKQANKPENSPLPGQLDG